MRPSQRLPEILPTRLSIAADLNLKTAFSLRKMGCEEKEITTAPLKFKFQKNIGPSQLQAFKDIGNRLNGFMYLKEMNKSHKGFLTK